MRYHHTDPTPGSWYMPSKSKTSTDLKSFSVIDYESDDFDHSDYVDIQYLDGELDRLDMDTWDDLNPEEIAEPEDATAPYGVEHDRDLVELLKEIEDQDDLEQHIRNMDSDEEEWN